MNDKNLIFKIQNDIANSNAKIISNNDNTTTIQKKFSSKYTEDISDSDNDDLTSYKNRNLKMINKLPNKNANNTDSPTKSDLTSNDKKKKSTKSNPKNHLKKSDKEKEKKNKNSDDGDNSEDNSEDDEDNSLNDEDEEDGHEYEYGEEFKKKVVEYVKNDNRIRELQAELKLLNGAKKTAEADILKHLERLGESNINITGGKLRVNQYESKEGLKEDIVKEAIMDKIKDPKIVEFILEKINEKRAAGGKVQVSLKRTFERGGGKKEK